MFLTISSLIDEVLFRALRSAWNTDVDTELVWSST